MDWRALAVGVLLVSALAWLVSRSDRGEPGFVVPLAAAAVASGAVLALHDPARSLVRSGPTSAPRRLARRLVLIGAPLVIAAAVSAAAIAAVFDADLSERAVVVQTLALFTAAMALHAVLVRRGQPRAAEVAAVLPLLWMLLETWFGGRRWSEVLGWWHEHPWWVAAAAAFVTVAATTGRDA